MILIVVKFPIRPDRQSEWEQLSAFYAKAVNAEPGCVFFEFSRSVEDPQTRLHRGLRGRCGQEHMKQDHVARFMAEMPDIVSAQPQIIYIDAQDVRASVRWGDHPSRGLSQGLGGVTGEKIPQPLVGRPKVPGPGGMRQESYAAPRSVGYRPPFRYPWCAFRAVSHCSAGRFRGASSEFHVEVHVVGKLVERVQPGGDLTHLGESRD